ncbi:CU044_5270 family protein [Streptomyces sp. CA-251251]|uniref:CU044_5270 family protein n=1 Tax=Streptomyces sp. CA-251251 TaxID=3240063 RepID=UPI003D8A3E87
MHQTDHAPSAAADEMRPAPFRRLPGLALALPVLSLALVGALAVAASVGGRGSSPVAGPTASAPARANDATVSLGRIAAAAMKADTMPVRGDQFGYVQRLTRQNTGEFGAPARLGAAHKEEVWQAQGPGRAVTTGWLRSSGKDAVMPGQLIPVTSPSPVGPGLWHPTYAWLASLPTDADVLLDRLHAETTVGKGESEDEAVFRTIGDLLGGVVMPPVTASALYRAVAMIPGVTWVPDAVDAAGRHGIGITREDGASVTRSVLIFDRTTLAYTGSQVYFTRPGARGTGAAGDVLFHIDAVVERGVVDRHGEVPKGAVG